MKDEEGAKNAKQRKKPGPKGKANQLDAEQDSPNQSNENQGDADNAPQNYAENGI